mmetsp:Transcript_45281/g.129892  ORF Transcript_45281/g.129892 Transcript_45281/m.129892 type:complete len:241 (+) Transcript_45281:1091-1813(+)
MSIVVQDSTAIHVGVELRSALCEHRSVKVMLLFGKLVLPNFDFQCRQVYVRLSFLLCSPKQDFVEHFAAQPLHSSSPGTQKAKLLDGIRDVGSEMAPMLHLGMATSPAPRCVRVKPVVQGDAIATPLAAKVVRVRIEADEPNNGPEFANAVLQRCAREAPPGVLRAQGKGSLGRAVGATFDAVGLVKNDAAPMCPEERRLREVDSAVALLLAVHVAVGSGRQSAGAVHSLTRRARCSFGS